MKRILFLCLCVFLVTGVYAADVDIGIPTIHKSNDKSVNVIPESVNKEFVAEKQGVLNIANLCEKCDVPEAPDIHQKILATASSDAYNENTLTNAIPVCKDWTRNEPVPPDKVSINIDTSQEKNNHASGGITSDILHIDPGEKSKIEKSKDIAETLD